MKFKIHFSWQCFFLICTILLPAIAFSHASSESYSNWQHTDDSLEVRFTIRFSDLNLLSDFFDGSKPGWQERLRQHIEQHLSVSANAITCHLDNNGAQISVTNGYFQYRNHYLCQTYKSIIITNNAFFSWDRGHMHVSRLKDNDDDLHEAIFLDRKRQWSLAETENSDNNPVSIPAFIILGFEHILSGADHLAFLLALLLLCLVRKSSLRAIVLLITGFTIGHSSSLFLSMNKLVVGNAPMVEAFIAWSILLLVLDSRFQTSTSRNVLTAFFGIAFLLYGLLDIVFENSIFSLLSLSGLLLFSISYLYLGQNLQQQSRQLALAMIITTAFGFIHGLGFAGNLQSYAITEAAILPALFGFNLGVEFGQLLVILLLFLAYKFLHHYSSNRLETITNGLLLLLAFGASFWFIERSIY